jgi:CHASE2 domain-containing sensor protein/signal transduction histidine kinase
LIARSTPRNLAPLERLVLATLLGGMAALLLYQGWTWRWDQLLYDAQLQLLAGPASEDIVIIGIDEQSLNEFGRWPWRRELHAELLDRLAQEQPGAIALDIIFAEPDLTNPQGDRRLARAIGRNGNVVLPVLMEQRRQGGIPTETLPYPLFAEQSAAMGHVHVELDPDGIARRMYLYEGLGGSYWPHLAMVMLQVAGIAVPIYPEPVEESETRPGVWYRAREMLIPYTGPPGHYPQLSYEQVVRGDFIPGTFTDKLVLVGVTASGLGDALPTPVSGYSHSMPGVEINANMLQALLTGGRIHVTDVRLMLAMTLLLAVLPVFIYPYLGPRNSLLFAAMLLIGTLGLSAALLLFTRHWFPPVPALVAITLGYPLWSWRRLEGAMRFLDQELADLRRQRAELAIHQEADAHTAVRFLSRILPLRGWAQTDAAGKVMHEQGVVRPASHKPGAVAQWNAVSHSWSTPVADSTSTLVLFWAEGSEPNERERTLLQGFAGHLRGLVDSTRHPADLLQSRIEQVKAATFQLRELRRFVEDALSFMPDGVIVADAYGKVLIANKRAAWYLKGDDGAQLADGELLDYLQDVELQEGASWDVLLGTVLVDGARVQGNARHTGGRDLLIQISPLSVHGENTDALVINFSDISNLRSSERKRSELLNFLSHDLRSPLVSMLALLELARGKKPSAALGELLERMQGNTERTLALAEQFLHLARVESSDEYTFSEVDLVAVVWNAHEQVWAQAKAREITLVEALDVEDAWITGEGGLLERALINLLTNAIKYSPPRTTITLQLSQAGDHYRCCVADEGYGIKAESLPVLFDRFKRVANPRHADTTGAGLGLAFVDAVITRHGGSISVDSTPGKGSVFCFSLRAMAGHADMS